MLAFISEILASIFSRIASFPAIVGWTPPAASASFFWRIALRSISLHSLSIALSAPITTFSFFDFLAIAILPHRSGFSRLLVSHPFRAALDRFLATLSLAGARFLGVGETGRGFFTFRPECFDRLAETLFFAPFRFFAI